MPQPQYLLALDQGTTSSRAIVFDHGGNIVAMAQREFTQHYPQPGWVEHDAGEIWSSQSAVTAEAVSKAGLKLSQIAAIGIVNQRETTLLWDRESGKPVGRAIVWQDRRTAAACRSLKAAGHEPTFTAKTGLRLDPYFAGTKLAWMLENLPQARERAECGELAFGTVESWLIWQFTGGKVHVTDAANASRTLLYNLHERKWDDELLGILGIPRSLLPEVRGNSEVYGHVSEQFFPAGVPIAGAAGDQQAALFGQNCTEPGVAKNTYGTGCFLLMPTGENAVPSQHNLLTTVATQRNGRTTYALEGSIFTAGAVVQWLRDELGIIRSAEESGQLAATVPDSGGVYLVPAFAGLGAPHWDPNARAAILGLTRGSNRAHLCRAALEAIAHQVADLGDSISADCGTPLRELRADGGAARSDFLLQFQADLLQIPVVRPKVIETTALGAAFLAGLATGFWQSDDEIAALWQEETRFEPQKSSADIEPLRHGWQRAVERSLDWAEG
ncbi:MAG: glycerol kinase GlpK [Opitutales bacterium]